MPTSITSASRAFSTVASRHPHADVLPAAAHPDFLILAGFAVVALVALTVLAALLPISGDLSAIPILG
jgi:hypothetical protein